MAVLHRSHRDSYDIGHFAANERAAVSWPLVAALAVAGLAIGWCLRAVVVRLAVPAGEPARVGCLACGQPILAPGRRLRSAPAPSRPGPPAPARSAPIRPLPGVPGARRAAAARGRGVNRRPARGARRPGPSGPGARGGMLAGGLPVPACLD